jgi:hypothetical protein
MPTKSRTKAQVRKDRAALKALKKSGYKGKIDLRKRPSKYQAAKIKTLKASKSKKGKPLPPKQKVPGATIKRSRMTEKQVRNIAPGKDRKLTTYALPFLRKGYAEPEWRRFTRSQLSKFLNEYKADDPEGKAEWRSYAVKEEWTFATKTEKTEFKRETDVYFSGVRISEPKGKIRKKLKAKKKRGK